MISIFVVFVSSLLAISNVMASADVNEFFPAIKGNLSRVTWAHAVNNVSFLESTLDDNDIMMIEADIVYGTVDGSSNEEIPIMGHPPANTSDLSLVDFLRKIDDHNNNSTNSNKTKKGVKLDFKTLNVFNLSLTVVSQYDTGNYPVWINADIISGPINATNEPVDAAEFLALAKQFNNTVLSIGWTTLYGSNMTGSYSTEHVTSMIDAISQNNVTQNVTFPVRAGLAARSLTQMQYLLGNVSKSTLTLWHTAGDNVNVSDLNDLILTIGVDKVYIDLPDDVKSQLNLSSSSAMAGVGFLSMAVAVFMILFNFV